MGREPCFFIYFPPRGKLRVAAGSSSHLRISALVPPRLLYSKSNCSFRSERQALCSGYASLDTSAPLPPDACSKRLQPPGSSGACHHAAHIHHVSTRGSRPHAPEILLASFQSFHVSLAHLLNPTPVLPMVSRSSQHPRSPL